MTDQTSPASEQRLDQLREQAWNEGVVLGRGVDVRGGPIPRKPCYYGQPIVKPPVWTWEFTVYFFVGGLAGMAAIIALTASALPYLDLAWAALWLAVLR